MKPHTEEQKQHLREALLRRWAEVSPEERAARKAQCAAFGRKSWAMASAERKAAQIARINTPEVRARNAAAIAASKARLSAEDPDWLKKKMRAKGPRPPLTEEQRKALSDAVRRVNAQRTPEQRKALAAAAGRARRRAVLAIPVNGSDPIRFESSMAAALWLCENRRAASLAVARVRISEALNGKHATAYDFIWRRDKE